jgi:hypothetical protein
MRLPLFAAFLTVAASAAAGEIKPADSSKPVFRILKFQHLHGGDHPQGTIDDNPLLVVWAVRDLRLASDRKGVLITLTQRDTKAFAAITRKYGYLVLDAGEDRPIEVMHITAPIIDGMIGFKHPDEAATAEYLRRRFRLAEFK